MKTRSGFTLIELSIVLVIIGLIIGGILIGRDLIHAAEVRKTITQIEQTKTAVATFEGKYNCLPGDCANASEFFPNAVNGDGDGEIGWNPITDPDYLSNYIESYDMWNHLSAAGLIPGSFSPFTLADYGSDPDTQSYPLPAANPQILAPSTTLAGSFLTVIYNATSYSGLPALTVGNYLVLSQIPYGDYFAGGMSYNMLESLYNEMNSVGYGSVGIYPRDGFAIDTKMDDGLPLTGQISLLTNAAWNVGCLLVDNSNNYNMAAGIPSECVMFITLGL